MCDGVYLDDLSPQRFHLGHGGIKCTENLLATVVLEERAGNAETQTLDIAPHLFR